jgi:hypothetical protein
MNASHCSVEYCFHWLWYGMGIFAVYHSPASLSDIISLLFLSSQESTYLLQQRRVSNSTQIHPDRAIHPTPFPFPVPILSISLPTAQTRHPPPTRSRNSRAVVTFGPTVREVDADAVADGDTSSRAVDGPGVWASASSSSASARTCDRWKTWPQAKLIRISCSGWGLGVSLCTMDKRMKCMVVVAGLGSYR